MRIGALPQNKRIAVIDSGMGGLTVAREIAARLPTTDIHYVADTAGFPYGGTDKDYILERLTIILNEITDKSDIDACVIACNTASTQVIDDLRLRFPFPFVGTVPAIKPAVLMSRSRRISVLATPSTAKSAYLASLIEQWADGTDTHVVAAPRLAQLAEAHVKGASVNPAEIAEEIKGSFIDLGNRRTDTIVLGCTHYPLLIENLKKAAPWPVRWLDPSQAIARQVMRVLYRSSFHWGPIALPRSISFQFTSGEVTPDLQARMRGLCEEKALSSAENHLLTGALA